MSWGRIILCIAALILIMTAFPTAAYLCFKGHNISAAKQKKFAAICILSFLGCLILSTIVFFAF